MTDNLSRPKILLLVPLPPPVHGSNLMNQHVVDCSDLYKNFEVRVISFNYAKSISDIGSYRLSKVALFIGYLFSLAKLIITFQPNLVYFVPAVTGLSFYRDFLLALAVKSLNCKLVYHLHGKGIGEKARRGLQRVIYKSFFRGASVIHLSKLLYKDIDGLVDLSSCKFIPNGIDLGNFVKRKKGDITSKLPIILYLSNLVPSKGPLVLLEACSILKSRGVDFRAYFVGNPSNEITQSNFEKKVRNKELESFVQFVGPKYGEEKLEAFQKADILAFPTFYKRECFPLILLEAMAASLPIVATNEAAIPEIVNDGETGFIVDKQNPKELADKLEYLIRHPARARKMGHRGFMKYKREYTLERFYSNLISALHDFAGTGSRPGEQTLK